MTTLKLLKQALLPSTVMDAAQTLGLNPKHLSDRRIFPRWARWVVWVRIEGMDLTQAQIDHCLWCLELFRAGVTTRQINRADLDDPRIPLDDRRALLRGYLEKWVP